MSQSLATRARRKILTAGLLLFVAIYLFPLYWMVSGAFKVKEELLVWPPPIVPAQITLENFVELTTRYSVVANLLNSLLVTVLAAGISTLLGSLAAFGLVRLRWPRGLNRYLAMWILGLRMLPPVSALVPIVLIWAKAGLVGTHQGLILAYVFFTLPFAIWIMTIYIRQVPTELLDAARVDGASNLTAFWRIAIPLARSGVAATFLLSAVFLWNEFLFAANLTRTATATMPVLVASFTGDRVLYWGPLLAAGTVALIPAVLVAFLAQRHIVSGLTLGSIRD